MQVKGNILLARVAFVKEHFGETGWQQVQKALPPEHRDILTGFITAVGWYPFAISKDLDQTIFKVLGKSNPKVFEEIGATSARKNLAGVHRHFITPGDPQAFLHKASAIYNFYYDIGRREYEQTGPTSGVLTTYDAETFSAADCLTVIGWYRVALGMCGAKDIVITEDSCRSRGDSVCRYVCTWKM